MTGVYLTPSYDTAWHYAFPVQLFGTEYWFRVVYEVLVNDGKQMGAITDRGPQNLQKVFAERAVEITRVIFDTNAPPQAGGHRYLVWKPELEALPPADMYYDPPLQIVEHWDGSFGLRSEAPPLDRTHAPI